MGDKGQLVFQMVKHVLLYSFQDLADEVKSFNHTKKAGFRPFLKYYLFGG